MCGAVTSERAPGGDPIQGIGYIKEREAAAGTLSGGGCPWWWWCCIYTVLVQTRPDNTTGMYLLQSILQRFQDGPLEGPMGGPNGRA